MSEEKTVQAAECVCGVVGAARLQREFQHLRAGWCWLLVFGILMTVCGAAAVVFPALTVLTTVVAVQVLGVVLIVAGLATIVMSFGPADGAVSCSSCSWAFSIWLWDS
jgi:uncharacterized membrane protein HdeD (DUF308 family)